MTKDQQPLTRDELFGMLSGSATASSGTNNRLKKVQLKSNINSSRQVSLQSSAGSTPQKTPLSDSLKTPQTQTRAILLDNEGPLFSPSATTPSKGGQRFEQRTNKGKIELIVNNNVPHVSSEHNPVECSISLPPGQQTSGYRYMYEKLTELGDVVDERVEKMIPILKQEIFKDLSEQEKQEFEFASPAIPHNEPVYILGRVFCDSPDENAKLNETSIMLETCRSIDNATRVLLSLKEYLKNGHPLSVFPGQIIACQGINPSGRSFEVSKVYYPPSHDMASTSLADILNYYKSDSSSAAQKAMNLMIAAGPYTLDDNFMYQPFKEFVQVVCDRKPDAVILMGPFVDSKHPMIESGDIDMFPDEIFKHFITPGLEKIRASRPGLKVVLVPSTRDLCTDFAVFPQPPLGAGLNAKEAAFAREQLGLSDDILTLPNPVMFQMNEVVIGISTQDIIMHMSAKEANKNVVANVPSSGDKSSSENRIIRLFRHILEQRSFYPLHPPAVSDAQIKLSHLITQDFFQVSPDILIVPSSLRYNAGCTADIGCLCIQPGRLTVGTGGGTFAHICLHLFDVEDMRKQAGDDCDPEEIHVQHCVKDRARVEIIRI